MTTPNSRPYDSRRAFRALVWKELHESRKIGAVLFLFFSMEWIFVLLFDRTIAGTGLSGGGPSFGISMFTVMVPLIAVVIAPAQLARESRGDARAFLTHRPATRATLFWAKALVGMLVYLVVVGVPLAIALVWQATPGHRPMPFDWRMTLPYVADLLCGLVYYAVGAIFLMRATRRRVSWFPSVLAPVICSWHVVSADGFWTAIGVVVVGVAIVGYAARGVFISGGQYSAMPRPARAALGLTLCAGLLVVGTIGIGIISGVSSIEDAETALSKSTDYKIASDAEVVQVTTARRLLAAQSEVVDVKDLAGRPIARYADSSSRGPSLEAGVISTAAIALNSSGKYPGYSFDHGYRVTGDFFVQLSSSKPSPSAVSWYFIRRLGLVAAYDNQSSRLIGWMGPDGYVAGAALPAHRFEGTLGRDTELGYKQSVLAFPSAVYHLDLPHRTIRKVYTALPGEIVLGAVGSGDSTATLPEYGPKAQFDAIATTRTVYVQSINGDPEVVTPRDPRASGYGKLTVSRATLAPGAPTILRYEPQNGTLTAAQRDTATDQLAVFGGNGALLARYTLPRDTTTEVDNPEWASLIVTASTTPMIVRVATSLRDLSTRKPLAPRRSVQSPVVVSWVVAILAALISGMFVFGIGRAYAFDSARMRLWVALSLALGPLGVLLLIALNDWPAREACPSCGRKRVVTREYCEHCGAPFGAPPRDGTEIFEPAA